MQTLGDFISEINDKYSQGDKIQLVSYYTELTDFDVETEGIELFNSFTTYPRMYWSNPDDGTILSFGQIRKFKADKHNYEGLGELVRKDFHILSKSYDLINNFMSLGVDRQFRQIAIKNTYPEKEILQNLTTWLDLGTGTGHLANELHKQKTGVFVVGLDISDSMLRFAMKREMYLDGCMNFILADVAKTPFRKESYSGAFSGFVGRHFRDYPQTLKEHHRIIQSKGRINLLDKKSIGLGYVTL